MIHAEAPSYDDKELERASIGGGPLVYPTSGGAGAFFDTATNGVTAGRIPSRMNGDKPAWLDGICWRPSMCVEAEVVDVNCANCGQDYGNNEVQSITIDATGGTFTASWDGEGPTGAIDFDAAPAAVQAALEALANIDGGDIAVSGTAGAYVITFLGQYTHTDVAEITLDGALLTGGGSTATPATVNEGGHQFQARAENETATAFEITLRDLNFALCDIPLTADALRMKAGKKFGGKLWEQTTATTLPSPEGDTSTFDAAVALDRLEQYSGFCGYGTILTPRVTARYLLKEHALIMLSNGSYRTPSGNRVITEGIPVTPLGGGIKMVITGPVDYAQTSVKSDTEPERSRGNDQASAHRQFGITRSDKCAAMEISATDPTSAPAE